MGPRGKRSYFNRTNDAESRAEPSSADRGSKHPRHLRGKAIGLWHARKNRQRAEDEGSSYYRERDERKAEARRIQLKKPLGSILISEKKKGNISKLLNETASIYPSSFRKRTNSYEHLEETAFKHEFLQSITGNIVQKLESSPSIGINYKNSLQDETYSEEFVQKQSSTNYKQMQDIRHRLPSMGMKNNILDVIDKNQVVVISGETGCGKTTQVAQFVLDDYLKKGKGSECKIICTQPRRISAIAVAERVAQERDEKLGGSVGFQIRLEKVMPRERGSILFCTTGVLLKYMESNPALSDVSHLILDEIHERNVPSDFLITLLKDVLKYRNDIKIILMSATLNSEAFSKYYNNAPHVNIPGFTYPVEEYFLEDVLQVTNFTYRDTWRRRFDSKEDKDYYEPYLRHLEADGKYNRHVIQQLQSENSDKLNLDLIFELIKHLCNKDEDGSILVFVPGFSEISTICNLLAKSSLFPTTKYIVIPLHSQLPTVDQKRIFNPAPRGMRKIIVSTNIAETSITIDDVTTVIDSGFIKVNNLDSNTGIGTLKAEWVSQANAAQRKGRAGRVKPGVCFHLITKLRYDLLDKYLKPEVLRKRLEDVILQLKILQLGDAEPFLAKLMDPPEAKSVEMSVVLLRRLGALDLEENLTPLGFHMAKLPMGPHCSKMLILAALFNCIDPVLSVVASLDFKDAFQLSTLDPKEVDKKKYELSNGTNSDHLCMHYAIRDFENAPNPRAFCQRYFLSFSVLRQLIEMRKQIAHQLFEMKFIRDSNPKSSLNNSNSDNIGLIKAIITAGLYPNIAIKRNRNGKRITNVFGEAMKIHPKSVLSQTRNFPSALFVYHLRQKSSSDFVYDGTVVFPLPIVFFGDQFKIHGSQEVDDDNFNGVSVNGTMRFVCSESTSLSIQSLRDRLNEILEWKLSHPGVVNWASDNPEIKILRIIRDLITVEDCEDLDLSDYDDV